MTAFNPVNATMTLLQDQLIVKAAYSVKGVDLSSSATAGKLARARMGAFAQVAADILHLTTAPFGFELALTEALREHPLDIHPGLTAGRASEIRSAWEADIVQAVRAAIIR